MILSLKVLIRRRRSVAFRRRPLASRPYCLKPALLTTIQISGGKSTGSPPILATENDSFADRLIFWQGQPEPGTIVDAKAETKRLRENAALGDAPTKGRTPKIVRKPKGWLEGVFNRPDCKYGQSLNNLLFEQCPAHRRVGEPTHGLRSEFSLSVITRFLFDALYAFLLLTASAFCQRQSCSGVSLNLSNLITDFRLL